MPFLLEVLVTEKTISILLFHLFLLFGINASFFGMFHRLLTVHSINIVFLTLSKLLLLTISLIFFTDRSVVTKHKDTKPVTLSMGKEASHV